MANSKGSDFEAMNVGLLSEDEVSSLRNISGDQLGGSRGGDLQVGDRVILQVKDHVTVSKNWREKKGATPEARIVLILRGVGVGSSSGKIEKAYVILVPDDEKLREPKYLSKPKAIHMWIHQRMLPTVLSQLSDQYVYCWMGNFGDGHIYADIHSSD